MPIKPPQKPFRVEDIDVMQVSARQLNSLAEPEPVIQYVEREVIKHVDKVVYKDDPKLLEHLNQVLKENGELKTALQKMPEPFMQESEPKVVEKFVEINHMVTNVKRELLIALMALLTGGLLCYLILK